MSNIKTLYKKDSKGKIRVINFWTAGGELKQESGLLGGNLVLNSRMCAIKNKGKSNETSASDQAELELESCYNGKLTEGYFKTEKEAQETEVILPMLAESYKDFAHKISWEDGVILNPKLDGMCCLIKAGNGTVTMTSRDGKDIMASNGNSMEHILNEFKYLQLDKEYIFHGELYQHDIEVEEGGTKFQAIMRAIKKHRPGISEQIKFHVYDMVETEWSYSSRMQFILDNLYELRTVEFIDCVTVYSEKELKEFHSKALHDGYEGTMVKANGLPYKINGRSKNLLKYKDFSDISLHIKDIRPSDRKPDEGFPVFQWIGAKNDELKAGMKFSKEVRREWLKNKDKYIGKPAELRFFEFSDNGVPRFPVVVGIRLDC